MPEFASDPWFQAFVGEINGSERYRTMAADWEGDVALGIEAEPDKRVPETIWGYLDLWHGDCRSGGVDPDKAAAAAFSIRAPYSRWKDIVLGELDPIRAMVQGKLKVTGDLATILRYVDATNELVHLAEQVDTTFPDEA